MTSTATKRIPSLDGLRAISISLVIICHYARDVGWGDRLDLGSLGVRIFFVISGYLITGLLLKEQEFEGHVSLIRFYFRRTMRIFPAFYFYIACMLVIAAFGWTELSVRDALPALTYTSNYFVNLQRIIMHTWSLSTEEQFYLIWPAALALAKPRRGIIVLIALLIIAPLSGHFLTHRMGHLVPAFFNEPIGIGCLLALTRKHLYSLTAYRRWVHSQLGLLLPFIILLCNFPALHRGGPRDAFFTLLMNASIALLLDWAVVNGEGAACRVLNTKWMIYIGTLSYSLYLWQQPFLALLCDHPALILTGPWRIIISPFLRFPLIAICTLISYYLVERPMLRIRARIEPRFFAGKRPSPLAPTNGTAVQGIKA